MATWKPLDLDSLRRWPLPALPADADKESRGRVLIVAGSREIAGAALLAATAALRAGAGKVAIATGESAAMQLAVAVPEARVIGLAETSGGGFEIAGIERIAHNVRDARAVLVGPGLMDDAATAEFTCALLACEGTPSFVVDATAMKAIRAGRKFERPVLVTPHAGEMASLLDCSKEDVQRDAPACALEASRRWGAVVALKGADTLIATPEGDAWRHARSQPGLAMSGSGDVLAGLAVGFLARGAALAQAAAWAVVLHAQAGRILEARHGPVGFLARELAGEVPALMRQLP